jgi:hypothetical protein
MSEALLRLTPALSDGARFLITKPLYPSADATVSMVVNWFPELRAKLAK